jgi:FMN reductase
MTTIVGLGGSLRHASTSRAAAQLIESCYSADGLIWSSPLYQGTISGSLKNALDWLHVLGQRDPPYLHDKVIGLISAAGGTQGLQAINTMEFAVRALRGWAVPYVVPLASAERVFGASGEVKDESVQAQLSMLGGEVVRVAELFARDDSVHRDHECAQAAQTVAAAG